MNKEKKNSIDMKDVRDYTWEDFQVLWENCAEVFGTEAAWKLLHQTWKLRAGEETE